MSNTFKHGETVIIESEVEAGGYALSGVTLKITEANNINSVVINTSGMENLGNQKFKYFWDTSSGYSAFSGYTGTSSYSGGVTSGYSGISGYSEVQVVGMYKVYLTAIDMQNHKGLEDFNIRITE